MFFPQRLSSELTSGHLKAFSCRSMALSLCSPGPPLMLCVFLVKRTNTATGSGEGTGEGQRNTFPLKLVCFVLDTVPLMGPSTLPRQTCVQAKWMNIWNSECFHTFIARTACRRESTRLGNLCQEVAQSQTLDLSTRLSSVPVNQYNSKEAFESFLLAH